MIRKSLFIILAVFALANTPACTSHSSDGAETSDDPDAKLDVDGASTGATAASDDAIADSEMMRPRPIAQQHHRRTKR